MSVARKNPVLAARGQRPCGVIPVNPERLQCTRLTPKQQVFHATARLVEKFAGLASRSTMTLTAVAAWFHRRAQL